MSQSFVDVWFGSVEIDSGRLDEYLSYLSIEELQVWKSTKNPVLKGRLVNVRGQVRKVVSKYLETHPSSVCFGKTEYGKPLIQGSSIQFNLSHSADGLLIGVSNFETIGVDLEFIKPRLSMDAIVERCFARDEIEYWRSVDLELKTVAFYDVWVRKEAFVKATGRGIALGLNQCVLDVPALDQFISMPSECGKSEDWLIRQLLISENYRAALVTPNRDYRYSFNATI